MKKVNYAFREKLNATLGGFSHNYCYQCGACVADCPAHRFLEEFNPRTIMLQAILGLEQDLIGEDTIIWNCTNCYNCYERCPQDANPIEVIIALKNISVQEHPDKPSIRNIFRRVEQTGGTVQQTSLIEKRRKELGLPVYQSKCLDELNTIFEQ